MTRFMIRAAVFTALVGALSLCAPLAKADTSVAGGALATQTWTAVGSPYLVAANVTVPEGGTLTIEPGAVVKFGAGVGMTIGGSLNAVGKKNLPIMFMGGGGATSGSWSGLTASSTAALVRLSRVAISGASTAVRTSATAADAFQLTDATISGGQVEVNAGAPILSGLAIDGGSVYFTADGTLSRSKITNTDTAVQVYVGVGGSVHVVVLNTVIQSASFGVVLTSPLGFGSITVLNSTLQDIYTLGLWVSGGGRPSAYALLDVANTVITDTPTTSMLSGGGVGVVSMVMRHVDTWNSGAPYNCYDCLSVDPKFVSSPTDLRLQAGSPCIDAGLAPSVAYAVPADDFLGNPRPFDGDGVNGAAYDIGAYEYGSTHEAGSGGDAGAGGEGGAGQASVSEDAGAGGNIAVAGANDGTAGGQAPAFGGAALTLGAAGQLVAGEPSTIASGGASDAAPAASGDENGCSCRASSQQPTNGVLSLGLACASALALRRRKCSRS